VVIGLAVTGLIIGFAAWMWGPETYRRMRILHWQGRVMEHRELPGTVRYTYVIGGGESVIASATNDSFRDALGQNANAGWRCVDPVIFLHARKSKGGERLVGVSFSHHELESVYVPIARIHISMPATFSEPPRALHVRPEVGLFLTVGESERLFNVKPGDVVKVYAGQASAADEAAFEIPFDVGEGKYVAKLRLAENAMKVEVDSVVER
jgi:hypothetical protein